MKQTVTLHDFRSAFQKIRPDNFSYSGLEVLFDYLEECEQDTGEDYELDVVALCCDFSEIEVSDLPNLFDVVLPKYEEEQYSFVYDFLNDEGVLIGATQQGTFIIRN